MLSPDGWVRRLRQRMSRASGTWSISSGHAPSYSWALYGQVKRPQVPPSLLSLEQPDPVLRCSALAVRAFPQEPQGHIAMTDVPIPADKLGTIQSEECVSWLMEHCPHSVVGRVDPVAGFVLAFEDASEAVAFRARWLSET